jgi:ribonucleotide monophosphatase NagD (HAD superfamily)
MEERIPTAQEIAQTISAARDSVWVIGDEILKENITKDHVQTVQRNVSHLELVMSNEHVTGSEADLSDLTAAIEDGNAFIELCSSLLNE